MWIKNQGFWRLEMECWINMNIQSCQVKLDGEKNIQILPSSDDFPTNFWHSFSN